MAFSAIIGVSFAMGSILATITMFLAWLTNTYGLNANFLKWGILPILGYAIAVCLNLIIQNVSCSKINPKQIALGSSVVPVSIFLFLFISLAEFIRVPIESAVPSMYRIKYGGLMAIAFYMFWAGMFGEAIAGGFAQACPSN